MSRSEVAQRTGYVSPTQAAFLLTCDGPFLLARSMLPAPVHVESARFTRYKALGDYSIQLHQMNILVGPNNNGKSTIIGAFRVLAQAIRIARTRKAEILWGPSEQRHAWRIPVDQLPISSENIHTNYDDTHSFVEFKLSNTTLLTLFFPDEGGCLFYADNRTNSLKTPSDIRRHAPIDLAVVPILGPLEHEEALVSEETVRKNLLTTRASRHFRNYWYYNTEYFDEFAKLVSSTWPDMEIERPERSGTSLIMFCLERRISRELFWSGFGFQIWLQLLSHISRSRDATIIIVDEPELYLHPDVQLRLLEILRDVGADVLVATHSTEIMSEADPAEIVLVDKSKKTAERLRDVEGVQRALSAVGSIQNITLTRLARNRRIIFTEGSSDFSLIRRFAVKLGYSDLAAGSDLTSMESGGFSGWERIRGLASAFEEALGFGLRVGAVFDRDYWPSEELAEIQESLQQHLAFSHIHDRKEIENYLLLPGVLDRALVAALRDRSLRTGQDLVLDCDAKEILEAVTDNLRSDIQSQCVSKRITFFEHGRRDIATLTKEATKAFEANWLTLEGRLSIVPGKVVLRAFRDEIARRYSVTVTDHRIVTTMRSEEIPSDLANLVKRLDEFRQS